MKTRGAAVAILALIVCTQGQGAGTVRMQLSSPDFAAGARLPDRFALNMAGCTGGNVSPALRWSGAPSGTKSYVITLFDPDEHATPSGWWHWVVYDIPANVHHLPGDAGSEHGTSLPAGARQGRSDLGNLAYHGPCPDAGDKPHHYVFTLYALSVDKLPVAEGASGAMVTYVAHDSTLAKATLTALYGR
jgi:Raf kinase inhibitor-like YbhB/YbcL family protein